MGLTATEKIIARRIGGTHVAPGEIHDAPVDLLYIHDNNAPIALEQFEQLPVDKLFDPSRVHFVLDHHSPASTHRAASHHVNIRAFAKKHGARVVPCGRGVSHPVMAEDRLVRPGSIVLGTDSHTVGQGVFGCLATGIGSTEAAAVMATGKIWLQVPPTVKATLEGALQKGVAPKDIALLLLAHYGPSELNYHAMEMDGPALRALNVDERMAVAIMGLEMGLKNAVLPVDETLREYLNAPAEEGQGLGPDPDAVYARCDSFDISKLEPMVALPSMPTNGAAVGEALGQRVDQATLGSCSGAFYHDLVQADAILAGRKVHPDVRFVIVPNTSTVVERAAKSGVLERLVAAGAVISSPACGTCGGYEVGCLAPAEICISTTTRNMDGRMGPGASIYLASAMTVAATAVKGVIADPREFLE